VGDKTSNVEDFLEIVEMLEETDASNLGMNVIWIDDYNEIPAILKGVNQEDQEE
jgi:hypothetical protein